MINNRQNGRRRGRGGPQMRGAGNGAERNNRIDNRARGNAAQLHEKYRNLARDAQTQGDRVMTEYYLQFADHYFRVLSESRARFEENQPRRQSQDDFDYGDEGDAFDERGGSQQPRQEQPRYEQRGGEPRFERPRGEAREDAAQDRQPPAQEQPREERAADDEGEAPRSRRARRPRRDAAAAEPASSEAQERIEIDRLPPAFVPTTEQGAGEATSEEEAPRRRRSRRVAKDDGDSVAA